MFDSLCKGSWQFGTACGHCNRCLETAPKYIKELKESYKELYSIALAVVQEFAVFGLNKELADKLFNLQKCLADKGKP